jgi:hypothetical protein
MNCNTCGCAPASSSSSSSSSIFNTCLTSTLGSNQEIPEFYYEENVGFSLTSAEEITVCYNNLNISGLPIIVDIDIDGEIVASLNVSSDYADKPFSITYRGNTYYAILNSGVVSIL